MSVAKIAKVDPRSPDQNCLKEAADIIRSGGLVIIPTETVYGIAANMLNKKAVIRLAKIKERAPDKPFSLHIYKKETLDDTVKEVPVAAYKLMDRFWPGPLTLILKSKKEGTVGIRMPDDEIAFKVIAMSQVPVICPSANLSGKPAPSNFEDAIRDLIGLVDFAIDSGKTRLGVESTVVDVTGAFPRILREGAISQKEIEETARKKNILFVCTGNSCRSVMAEALLKKMLRERNRTDVEVSSAGLMMMGGMEASEYTKEVLRQEGCDVSRHLSRRVTRQMIDESDLVLVMESGQEKRIIDLAPEAKNRVFLLREFAKIDDSDLDIEDPMGRTIEFYALTLATIKEAIERIINII